MGQMLWKTVWQFLNNLNGELPYHPAIALVGLHPEELKTGIQTNTYVRMCVYTYLHTYICARFHCSIIHDSQR